MFITVVLVLFCAIMGQAQYANTDGSRDFDPIRDISKNPNCYYICNNADGCREYTTSSEHQESSQPSHSQSPDGTVEYPTSEGFGTPRPSDSQLPDGSTDFNPADMLKHTKRQRLNVYKYEHKRVEDLFNKETMAALKKDKPMILVLPSLFKRLLSDLLSKEAAQKDMRKHWQSQMLK